MYTAPLIRRHINRLQTGRLFTSREFLIYGSRAAVDQSLFRLVRKGWIIRMARGVFVKEGTNLQAISLLEVAKVKAASFGKQLSAWGGDLARDLGLRSSEETAGKIYAINGSSSSFRCGNVTVFFRRTCARKLRFADNPAGRFLKSLWHLGRAMIMDEDVASATRSLGRTDRYEIRTELCWTPEWLSAHLLHWRLPMAFLKCYPTMC